MQSISDYVREDIQDTAILHVLDNINDVFDKKFKQLLKSKTKLLRKWRMNNYEFTRYG